MKSCAIAAVLAAAMIGAPSLADGPIEMEYDITDLGGGVYEYEFWLILANTDGSWAPGQGWAWVVFGDQESDDSPLTDFVGNEDDLPIGPWTFYTETFGFHNGPTLGPVTDYWIPTVVGETLYWTGTSSAFLGQGELLFSTLLSIEGGVIADFKVATFIPAPGAFGLLGVAALFGTRRRRV